MAHKPDLVLFYEGVKGDYRNRKLQDILQWTNNHLEQSHDYIQTLFPLPEQSGVNYSAPIVDRHVFEAFRSEPQLRANLRTSFSRMLTFYGLKWSDNKKSSEITLGINFDEAKENWVRRYDHNHLRITRIIRSLRVLGLEEEALAFYRALEKVQSESAAISARSLTYWRRAAFRPLHIQPSVDEGREEDVRGPAFLREYEELKHMELKGDMTADGTSPAGLKGQADRANHEQANEAQMANSTDIGHPSPKSPRDEIAKEADSGSSEDEMVRWRTGDTKN